MVDVTVSALDNTLLDRLDDDYLRWHIGAGADRRVWSADSAAVVAVPRPIDGTPSYGLLARGEPREVVRSLLDAAARDLAAQGVTEIRLSLPPTISDVLPPGLAASGTPTAWEWLWTDGVVPVDGEADVTELADGDLREVDALLRTHSPRAHASPGDPDVLGWAGVRMGGLLVAAGAVVATAAGTPHLRAIVTVPNVRGRGLGSAVTAHLTRWGLQRSPRVSLALYADNAGARRLYRRLGYRGSRSWVSNGARLSTSASRPAP